MEESKIILVHNPFIKKGIDHSEVNECVMNSSLRFVTLLPGKSTMSLPFNDVWWALIIFIWLIVELKAFHPYRVLIGAPSRL